MPDASAAGPNPGSLLVPIVMMFGIFYVLVFRPQAKQRKQQEQLLKNLKKHDEVVTSGGLYGTIVNLKPDTLTLRIDYRFVLDCERPHVQRLAKSRAEVELGPVGTRKS